MEHRKCGNPDHPEVGKSEINQKPKPIKKKKQTEIAASVLYGFFFTLRHAHLEYSTLQTSKP